MDCTKKLKLDDVDSYDLKQSVIQTCLFLLQYFLIEGLESLIGNMELIPFSCLRFKCCHLKLVYCSYPVSRLRFQSQFLTSQILIFGLSVPILAGAFFNFPFQMGFFFFSLIVA